MSDRTKATLYACFVCGLIGSLIGLYIAESDIKRDCTKLGRVVLLEKPFECREVKP